MKFKDVLKITASPSWGELFKGILCSNKYQLVKSIFNRLNWAEINMVNWNQYGDWVREPKDLFDLDKYY